MRLWAIVPAEPLTDDRAYLLGHLKGCFDEIETSFVDRQADEVAAPSARPDLILNQAGGRSPGLLAAIDAIAERFEIPVSQPSAAARRADDKRSYIADFPDVSPETRVVRNLDEIRAALSEYGEIVVKDPLGMRGKGVERIRGEDDLAIASALLDKTTDGVRELVAQPFLSGFSNGDKRVIVQRSPGGDYQIIGQIFRKPRPGEWKSSLRSGGKALRAELSDAERELALKIAPRTGLDNATLDMGEHEGRLFYIEHNQGYGGIVDYDLDRGGSCVSACAEFLVHLASHGRAN